MAMQRLVGRDRLVRVLLEVVQAQHLRRVLRRPDNAAVPLAGRRVAVLASAAGLKQLPVVEHVIALQLLRVVSCRACRRQRRLLGGGEAAEVHILLGAAVVALSGERAAGHATDALEAGGVLA
jgi:hypothetical protein